MNIRNTAFPFEQKSIIKVCTACPFELSNFPLIHGAHGTLRDAWYIYVRNTDHGVHLLDNLL